jgi:hypothetical protein
MGTMRVVVLAVFVEYGLEMAATEDERPVEPLVPQGANRMVPTASASTVCGARKACGCRAPSGRSRCAASA